MSPSSILEPIFVDLRSHRIVLTGGQGFVAKNMAAFLEAVEVPYVAPGRRELNLLQLENVRAFLQPNDYVIHLAANVGGIQKNIEEGEAMFLQNLQMGMNVLNAAKERAIAALLIAGTACAYPEHAPLPLREETVFDGLPHPDTGPYGMAKRTLLYYGIACASNLPYRITHVIPTNIYGPFDHFNPQHGHVIPSLIARMYAARQNGDATFSVWGDGTQTREFIAAKDLCRGMVLALCKAKDSSAINLGSGIETRIGDLAHMIKKLIGYEGTITFDVSAPVGNKRRLLDVTKAKRELDFEAAVGLEEGLRETIAYFLAHVAQER